MATRQEYAERMKRQLDDWKQQIDELETKVSESTGPARKKLRARLDEVRRNYAAAKSRLGSLETAGDASWHRLKGEAEHVWDTLKHSINYFRSQL